MELISKPSSDPASPKLTAQPTPAFLPRSQRAYSSSPPCMLNDTFSLKEVKEVDARADSTGAGAGTGGGLALRVVAAPAARRSSLTPEAA